MNTRIPTDHLEDLARHLPAPAERDLPAGGQQLRDQLTREFRQAGAAGKPAPRWWRRPRIAVPAAVTAAVAAGASAALIAVGLPATPGTPPRPAPTSGSVTRPAPAAHGSAAAQLLAKIAVAAGQQPAPVVRNSEYEYVKTVERYQVFTVKGHRTVVTMPPALVRETWLPVYNLCRPLRIHAPGQFPGHATITSSGRTYGASCPELGNVIHSTYQWEATAPTDPHVLLRLILNAVRTLHYGKGKNVYPYAFSFIGDMVDGQIVPPKFAAALYQTAALIPGVTIIQDVPNAIGQHGVAIAMADGGVRTEWIFDKATLLPIGEREIHIKTGALQGSDAILASGFVAKIGQIPHGEH